MLGKQKQNFSIIYKENLQRQLDPQFYFSHAINVCVCVWVEKESSFITKDHNDGKAPISKLSPNHLATSEDTKPNHIFKRSGSKGNRKHHNTKNWIIVSTKRTQVRNIFKHQIHVP